MKKLVVVTFLGLVLAVPASAGAVGLSVSPKELKVEARVHETVFKKIKVSNPSGEVSVFEVYPDDLDYIVEVSPASFILESEEFREVVIQVVPREEGIFKTNISVVATPVTKSAFNAGSGVKIPLEISAGEGSYLFMASLANLPFSTSRVLGVVILGLILIAGFFVIKYGIKQIKG